ncbi:hypothetical protein K8I61_10270, partial [bacterium]|nr:hypothetical protein [bacterium]
MFSWIYASSTPAIIALLAAALFVAPPMAFADDDPPSAFVAEIDDRGGRSIAWNGETIAFAIDRDGDGLAEIGAWIFAGRVQRATVDLNRDGSADLLARVDEDGRATWHARAEGAWRPIPD